jgi:hypothetical protein
MAKTVAKPKNAKIFTSDLNLKVNFLHQTTFETHKYLQQTMFKVAYLGKKAKNCIGKK